MKSVNVLQSPVLNAAIICSAWTIKPADRGGGTYATLQVHTPGPGLDDAEYEKSVKKLWSHFGTVKYVTVNSTKWSPIGSGLFMCVVLEEAVHIVRGRMRVRVDTADGRYTFIETAPGNVFGGVALWASGPRNRVRVLESPKTAEEELNVEDIPSDCFYDGRLLHV